MKKKYLKLGHINIARKQILSDVIQRAAENEYDILSVNEVPAKAENLTLGDFVIILSKNDPRVALVILNSALAAIPLLVESDFVSVNIKYLNLKISTAYVQPRGQAAHVQRAVETSMARVKEYIKSNTVKSVLVGDLNAHSEKLGDKTDKRGKELQTLAELAKWVVLNEPGVPTYRGSATGCLTVVDWTLLTPDLVPNATWRIDPDPLLNRSDHFFIEVVIPTKLFISKTSLRDVVPIGALLRGIEQLNITADPEPAYDRIVDLIERIKKPALYREKNFEWTPQMEHLKNCITSISSKVKTREEREYIRTLDKMLDKSIVRAKKEWAASKYLGKTQEEVYQMVVRDVRRKQRGSFREMVIEGQMEFDDVKIARHALDHFFGKGTVDPHVTANDLDQLGSDDPPFTASELEVALQKMKLKSVPGRDMITTSTLRLWKDRKNGGLLDMLNSYLRSGRIPASLKDTRISLLKKNDHRMNEIGNFRPIGLQSKVCKTLERMLAERITLHLEKTQPLNGAQYGFREGASTFDALYQINAIRNVNTLREVNEAILTIDIHGAYNNVSTHAILAALRRRRTPNNVYKLLADYFTNRTASIDTTAGPISIPMTTGITQGSTIGPLLFNVCMDDVLTLFQERMSGQEVDVVAFADDLTVIISGWSANQDLNVKLNTIVNLLTELLANRGMEIAKDKLKLMLTTRDGELYTPQQFEVAGASITSAKSITILGLTFEHDNSFKEHLANCLTKAQVIARSMREAMSRKNKMPPGTRGRLVRTKIYPIYTYASGIWFDRNRSDFADIQSRIVTASNLAAVLQMDLYRTTSHTATLVVGEIPCLLNDVAVASQTQRQLMTGRQASSGRRIDRKTPMKDRSHPAERLIARVADNLRGTGYTGEQHDIKVYCEGSIRITGGLTRAAAGYTCSTAEGRCNSQALRISNNVSQFQASVEAIAMAIDHLAKKKHPFKATLLTKNESFLKSINNHKAQSEELNGIRGKLKLMERNNQMVTLTRIGPKDDVNDLVTLVQVNQIAMMRPTIEKSGHPVSRNQIKKEARTMAEEYVQEVYEGRKKSTIQEFFQTVKAARRQEVTWNPYTSLLYTGHFPVTSYYKKIRFSNNRDGKCACGHDQTVPHVLIECNNFGDVLDRAREVSGINRLKESLSLQEILRTSQCHRLVSMVAERLYHRLIRSNCASNSGEPPDTEHVDEME